MDVLIKGYPISIGGKQLSILDHSGPAAPGYVVVTPADPPTGGDVVEAAAFGLKFIEGVAVGGDESGLYAIVPIHSALDSTPRSQVTLRWFTAVTMAEVVGTTVLSGHHCRLIVWGG